MALQLGVLVQFHDRVLHRKSAARPFGWRPVTATVDSDDPRLMRTAARERTSELFGLEVTTLTGLFCGEVGEHTWTVYGMESRGDAVEINRDVTEAYAWLTTEQMNNLARTTALYMNGKISEREWTRESGLEPGWCDAYLRLEPSMLIHSPMVVGVA